MPYTPGYLDFEAAISRHGCFFQCLEGAAESVDALYRRLGDDKRHSDLTVLSREPISQPAFSDWSMKYVPNAAVVGKVLARPGLTAFNPYSFKPAMMAEMVSLLLSGPDAAPTERQVPVALEATGASLAIARRAQTLAAVALVTSIAALAAAILS